MRHVLPADCRPVQGTPGGPAAPPRRRCAFRTKMEGPTQDGQRRAECRKASRRRSSTPQRATSPRSARSVCPSVLHPATGSATEALVRRLRFRCPAAPAAKPKWNSDAIDADRPRGGYRHRARMQRRFRFLESRACRRSAASPGVCGWTCRRDRYFQPRQSEPSALRVRRHRDYRQDLRPKRSRHRPGWRHFQPPQDYTRLSCWRSGPRRRASGKAA